MTEPKLGDRIVNFIRTEGEALRKKWAEEGLDPLNYSVAFEVKHIADSLGEQQTAVKGALAGLHKAKRVIGYRVIGGGGDALTYAIAVREE